MMNRRDFARGIAFAAILPAFADGFAPDENAVGRFFRSLNAAQREALCFPIDHPSRGIVRNNWAIVRPTIGDLLKPQQELCLEILRYLSSDDGFERIRKVMDDDFGGFANYHVALFGELGEEKPCEWALTGRHLTIRCDASGAISGPIFFGHSADVKTSKNAWSFLTETAQQIFAGLDDHQKFTTALKSGEKRSVVIANGDSRKLLRRLASSFRKFAVKGNREASEPIDGTDEVHLTFYERDVWKLVGPGFSWYFHGSPHVHCWLEVTETVRSE